MPTGPTPSPEPVRVRRRRKRSKPARVLLVSALICLPLLLAIPVARYFGWLSKGETVIYETSTKVFDVVLSEARLEGEGAGRAVRGVVFNKSGTRYVDVQISFILRSHSGVSLGTAVATAPAVEPNGSATFQTGTVAPEVYRASLREISGTKR